MSTAAPGIHTHPTRPLGRQPRDPDHGPTIKFSALRTAAAVSGPLAVPPAVDDTTGVVYALDHNDQYGDCVPTGKDNLHRTISRQLTGSQVSMTWDQVVADYRTQNPRFPSQDDGMNMQDYLTMLAKRGDILAFAEVDVTKPDELREALWLFLALYAGVDLQIAQQSQTDDQPPVWDYEHGSGQWGGHCICLPADETDDIDAISWAERIPMTPAFVEHQLDECYVVIFPEHLAHPDFRAGVDVGVLASEYERLTGRTFPGGPTPAPQPTPTPVPAPVPVVDVAPTAADETLKPLAEDFLSHRHIGAPGRMATALRGWLDSNWPAS